MVFHPAFPQKYNQRSTYRLENIKIVKMEYENILALVYDANDNIISGARYQRVATYSVMNPAFDSGLSSNPRAKPKSQI